MNLESIHAESRKLDETVKRIMNGSISNDILQVRWPLGVPPPSMPETRHDLQTWSLMNETHQVMPNSEENLKLLSRIDQEDVKVRFKKVTNTQQLEINEHVFILAGIDSDVDRSEENLPKFSIYSSAFALSEIRSRSWNGLSTALNVQ